MILVPLGISFAIKLIPKDIMDECRIQAEDIFRKGRPKNLFAGGIIIFIWLVLIIYIFKKLI
ncbi:hypothetical protein [Clostridium chromiireducens]|uniref:hypothetical protein n=1 Tax=Clostridium chromiireducens TaxID=225345 RepID=UPI001FAB32C4|nr:hypothetical protein [Clostridium chromiireducens]